MQDTCPESAGQGVRLKQDSCPLKTRIGVRNRRNTQESHEIAESVTDEVFTTPLGKCAFEALNYQRYFVDVWETDHDNYILAYEDLGFVETQVLEPGYIHDFVAYVDYYTSEKKMVLTRVGKKKWAKEQVSMKKASQMRDVKENKFSRPK